MTELDPHYLALKDGRAFKIRRSQFRGHVRDGQDQFPIAAFRDIVASGGGLALSGSAVLAILKEAGQQEPSWPGPGDELDDDLAQAVVELRLVIHSLLDDKPTAPGERLGRAYVSDNAWGLRHASLCG
ncbi:hypothetical protein [Methylobacterium sp. WL7]|uniref:hypothetical protein n=1 Tax=Methylobacterium sp. WL7 TaxID=2603900 RepID=UPI0011CC3AAB|nr:hypothetical protein [Methylobacterium sp. WL7]TXN47417.1 hypothetical protein FV233_05160 [Methylobacterium sp. WL7]